MTAEEFRRLALEQPGAMEGAHMGHADFRTAAGRIFATLPEARRGMVKVTPEQQALLCGQEPDVYAPAAGAWGRQGCTLVNLKDASAARLGEAMADAWRNAVSVRKKKK